MAACLYETLSTHTTLHESDNSSATMVSNLVSNMVEVRGVLSVRFPKARGSSGIAQSINGALIKAISLARQENSTVIKDPA